MHNKNIYLTFLVLLLTSVGLFAQSTKKTHFVKPIIFQKRVTTLVGEKTRYYYSLSDSQPSTINIQGPGKIRVISRGRFIPKQGSNISYQIVYRVDGAELIYEKFSNVSRSKTATYKKGSLGVPGQLKDFEIEIGRGHHTIELFIKDKAIPVAARYSFTPSRNKKQEWIAFSPIQPTEPVDLVTRESTVNYYRFSIDKPLKVVVNGPTELRVLTRVENHYQMKGRIHYRMKVMEEGRIINTYQLSSRRSDITIYKSQTELIPGKACEFVIDVPKGRHTYIISPLDKDKNTLLGRFLLPKKDVKLKK